MDTKERKRMHPTNRRPGRKPAPSQPVKESDAQVQYTPAKPFNRNRFLLQLVTVAAVVLALFVVMSIFFKVDESKILISGTDKYTAWEVREASGLRDGDGLLGLSRAKISARIRARLPYVDTVRIGIKLPDTVNIEITERVVVYAVEDVTGVWWLLNTEGRIVDSTDAATAMDYTRILGLKVKNAAIGELATVFEPAVDPTDPTTPIEPVASAKQSLEAALQIFVALEENGIMGKVSSINTTDLTALTLLYDNRYEVNLGNTERLTYKIGAMKAAIEELGQYQSGYLDASFTVWPNEVGYKPFDDEKG